MFYELNDYELEKIKEARSITDIDYETKGYFIRPEELIKIIRDMIFEYNILKEKNEEE